MIYQLQVPSIINKLQIIEITEYCRHYRVVQHERTPSMAAGAAVIISTKTLVETRLIVHESGADCESKKFTEQSYRTSLPESRDRTIRYPVHKALLCEH